MFLKVTKMEQQANDLEKNESSSSTVIFVETESANQSANKSSDSIIYVSTTSLEPECKEDDDSRYFGDVSSTSDSSVNTTMDSSLDLENLPDYTEQLIALHAGVGSMTLDKQPTL